MAFLARGSGFQLFITPDAAVLRFPDQVVRMELAGANRDPQLSGADRLPGQSHYLTGETWIRHVPHFGRVNLRGVYSGIDLSYYGNGSQLEYDFVIHPDADPRRIAIDIHGANHLMVGKQGELRIRTESGEIVWNAPVAYQEDGTIKAEYVLRGKKRVGFRLGAYDRSKPVVIDPILAWSTLLGGTGFDHAYAVAVDATENAVVTGDAGTSDFPTTAGAYKRTVGGVFVSKLNAAGTALLYSTFLGPGRGNSIALHGGNAYVTGTTTGTFPVTAYNDSAPGKNIFITKLSSDGSGLVYSALLGQGFSEGWGIAVDSAGNAYVTGTTTALNFATTASAFQPTRPTSGSTLPASLNAFFVKLNATGTALLYATYLGSTENDLGEGIAVDSSGHAYVTGSTEGRSESWQGLSHASLPFPTTAGTYKTTFIAAAAPFVTKFDPTASGAASVVYSTLLGADFETSLGYGIAVDALGNAYVTGNGGANFPLTAGAYGASSPAAGAFVTKLNPTGSALVYSAMIAGGNGQDITLNSFNNAFVIGLVTLSGFVQVNPLAGPSSHDLFLSKLNPSGSAVEYSTYLEGHSNAPVGVAIDPSGMAYVAGTGFQFFSATPGAYQTVLGGGTDAFVSKILTNRPPVANAGSDQNVNVGSSFTLDGSSSSDPEGNSLTYLWKEGTTTIGTSPVLTNLTRPQGVHTFTLTVSDGDLTASANVTISIETRLLINIFGLVGGTVTSTDGKIDCSAGSPGCLARYSSPTTVNLVATPGTGVVFTEWKSDCSGSGGCSVTMSSDHLVGAQFNVQQLTLSVTTPANGKINSTSGINCPPSCQVVLPYNTTSAVTLNATADLGFLFDTWSGDCLGTSTPCSLIMDSNKSAAGSFKEITLDSVAVAPASATIATGQQQRFNATGTFSDGSVRPLSGDHSVEATDDRTCAITSSGVVKCWAGPPAIVAAYQNAIALSAGTSAVCALFTDGTVNCGSGAIPGITTAVAIAHESENACALLSNGTIRCWPPGGTPVTVSGITNATAIGAEGGGSACAILEDGTVQCWLGLGDANTCCSSTPSPISGINNATAVAVGAVHACALVADGTVKCWWSNSNGQLGDGTVFTFTSFSASAVPVINVNGATSIVTGDYHSCALLENGTVKCWGMAYGNGRTTDSSTPIAITNVTNAIAVAAGAWHNCVTLPDRTVKCWGLNNMGQLGVGNPPTTTPQPVSGVSKVLNLSWGTGNAAVARMTASGRAIASNAGNATISANIGSLSANATLTVLNTATGNNVVTRPVDTSAGGTPVTVTFNQVTQIGSTSLTTSASGPTPPAGFQLSGNPPRDYELTTTATYTPPVTVCISYAGSISGTPPQLYHYEGGVWKDITKLPIDTVNQIVCGEVSSLSHFALFEPVNHPPVADAGADRVVECPTLVTLDGSQSSDPDHDSLTYLWTGPFGEAHGVTTTVNLPLGVTTATLTVSDGRFTSTDTVQITVRDTVAPAISSATPTPNVLWPPEHKMEPVTVSVAVSDLCDSAARCRIEDVTSNEPIDGLGDGDTSPDWTISGDLTLELRAERSAKGSGRIYTITLRCTDASNNSSLKTVQVTVPRHR